MWKPTKVTDDVAKLVMAAFAAEYEARKKKTPKVVRESFDEWAQEVVGVRSTERWTATENALKVGRLIAVHGIADSTSCIIVFDASGKHLGSHTEYCGQDRSGNRRTRVVNYLGKGGERLL